MAETLRHISVAGSLTDQERIIKGRLEQNLTKYLMKHHARVGSPPLIALNDYALQRGSYDSYERAVDYTRQHPFISKEMEYVEAAIRINSHYDDRRRKMAELPGYSYHYDRLYSRINRIQDFANRKFLNGKLIADTAVDSVVADFTGGFPIKGRKK